MTLLQEINYVFFATWQGITSKRITNYIPESDIVVNGHLDQQKQWLVTSSDANLTPISTRSEEDRNELLLQIFDSTENIYSNLTGKISVQ